MSQMPPMEQLPPQGNKTGKTLLIFGGIIFALLLCGGALCVGGIFTAGKTIADTEKAYYPACETLTGTSECEACCKQNGHSGYMAGAPMNEPGKTCGCIM